jgi:hypothetical protein
MKKKDFLWSMLAIFMAATMSMGLSSCFLFGGDDDDDPVEFSLSTDKVTLSSEQDSEDTFEIIFKNGSVSWKITQIPDFVTIPTNDLSGNENKKITVKAKNNNDSDKDLTGTIIVEAKGASPEIQNIDVTQKWLSGLSAEPTDELLMCRGYAYRVSCGSSTKYFYQKMYTQSDYNKMSEKEVISDVVTGKVDDRDTPSDENFYSWNLKENTSYVLAIVPYGEKDRQGKLYVQKFKTKKSDSEPQVDITNFSINWDTDSYVWNITKNTYCASYYMYATASKTYFPTFYWMEEGALALIGWAIRSEMEKDDSNHLAYINQNTWKDWGYSNYTAVEKFYAQQINDGTSSLSANPLSDKYMQIVVWGTKSNGDLSGYLTFGYADWSDTSTNNSRALTPLRMDGSENGKLKCIRGNLKDFDLIRIK